MRIHQLNIESFRNLSTIKLNLNPGVNLFYGNNGSGKTSLLEAVYFLGFGRSFRTSLVKRVVQETKSHFSLFSEIIRDGAGDTLSLGMMKTIEGKMTLKLNSETIYTIAELASQLPLLFFNAEAFRVLKNPPKVRRALLDWGVFHVEHLFFSHWQKYQRLLKHRNALLRQKQGLKVLEPWDHQLSQEAEIVDNFRQKVFLLWEPLLNETLSHFLGKEVIKVAYQRGWKEELSLKECLLRHLQRDQELQYTQYGPHRADLSIKVNGIPAQDKLSTGQQKMLVSSLYLSLGRLLKSQKEKPPIFLVDDLPAELDNRHLSLVMENLSSLDAQVLLTNVGKPAEMSAMGLENMTLFHVEHGKIAQKA